MDKKLLEEIKRIKFISDYDNSTTINEQAKPIQIFPNENRK